MKLIDAPIGLFLHNGQLVLKTEYSTVHSENGRTVVSPDCYIVSSGEHFWGGTKTADERNNLEVTPIESSSVAIILDQPMTVDEMRQMGGKPYWHVGLQKDSKPPHWAILEPIYAKHIEDYYYGKRWLGYRCPPEEASAIVPLHAAGRCCCQEGMDCETT